MDRGQGGAPPPGTPDPLDGLATTFAASLAVLLLALLALFHATAGGTGFTTETLRRHAVAQAPMSVPDYPVVDAQGRQTTLRSLLAQDGRVRIVDFVYTRCATLCLALGTVFQQLQAQIDGPGPARPRRPAVDQLRPAQRPGPGAGRLCTAHAHAARRLAAAQPA